MFLINGVRLDTVIQKFKSQFLNKILLMFDYKFLHTLDEKIVKFSTGLSL